MSLWDVRCPQENVLSESKMMIPDCRKRLVAVLAQLETALATVEGDMENEEDVTAAKQLVTNVQTLEVAQVSITKSLKHKWDEQPCDLTLNLHKRSCSGCR